VELIVELRWLPPYAASQQPQQIIPTIVTGGATNRADEFFMQFGVAANVLGYKEVERMGMVGFPFVLHQPVFRFRPPASASDGSLYQVGVGLFTANAVPPYESWEKFSPIVSKGIKALLESRPEGERESDFLSVSLRYIDAFKPQHTGGKDLTDFLEGVFGFKIEIPNVIAGYIPQGMKSKPMLQLQVPLAGGLIMNLGIGEGYTPDGQAIMMDTNVSSSVAVDANLPSVMAVLNSAHEVIRSTFTELIKPIEHLMPLKKNSK